MVRKHMYLVAILAVMIAGFAGLTGSAQSTETEVEVIRFDVAEDATRFVFDETPVFDDDLPAYGNSFVTRGYIYPEGTLDDSSGVLPNGEPEFPEQVIGEWSCRGWFVGDGAHTEEGPWVLTTQIYDLGDELGAQALVTEGYELPSMENSIQRAITGGTGRYASVSGDVTQQFLGFNDSEGVKLRFEFHITNED